MKLKMKFYFSISFHLFFHFCTLICLNFEQEPLFLRRRKSTQVKVLARILSLSATNETAAVKYDKNSSLSLSDPKRASVDLPVNASITVYNVKNDNDSPDVSFYNSLSTSRPLAPSARQKSEFHSGVRKAF